jgi:hypothetical protein
MTTSNINSYNPARDTIIKRSLRMVGAYSADGNPTATQITDAGEVLNIMLKSWQMDGMLWLRVFGTLFLNKGQRQYSLAPSTFTGFSHCAVSATQSDTPYVQTVTTAVAALGSNQVHLASTTGMTNADYIGIANDNGIIEWFTAAISGLVVSLSGTLSAAVASGNVVYSHKVSTQCGRPTRVTSVVRKLYDAIAANGSEIPLEPPEGLARVDYERLPNKMTQGKIISTYYDPQLVAGQLYVWPTADTPNDKLVLTMDREIQDMISSTDTFDVPQEALRTISYCLALEIEPEYPLDPNSFQKLATVANLLKTQLLNYNREMAATSFQIDWR